MPRAIRRRPRVALLPGISLDDPTYARALPSLCRELRALDWDARAFGLGRHGARALAAFSPGLVNVHLSGRVSAAACAALRGLDVPLILTFQDLDHPDLPPPSAPERARLRLLVERAERLVALTPRLAQAVRRAFPGRPVSVIGNGVGPDCFTAARPRRGPAIAVARLAPYKGIDVLLWSFAALARERPRARLTVYGRDFQAGHYQRLARRLGLEGRVRFAGAVGAGALRRRLATARLFVSASRRETYGMAVLEAMAAAAPIVATRTGAAPSLLRQGRSACLVPPGDPAALERALRRLWDDGGARARLGAAARRAAAGQTWRERARRYARLFDEVLHGR